MNLKSEIQMIQRQSDQVKAVREEIQAETCACGRPARPNSDLCYVTYGEMRACHIRIAKLILAARGEKFV